MKQSFILSVFLILGCSMDHTYSKYYQKNKILTNNIVENFSILSDSCNCNFGLKKRNDDKFNVINFEASQEDMVVISLSNITPRFVDEDCNKMLSDIRFLKLMQQINSSEFRAVINTENGIFLSLGLPLTRKNDTWYGGLLYYLNPRDSLKVIDSDMHVFEKIDSNVYIYEHPIIF